MAACAACPGAAAASIIRAAPMRHPARDSASRASPVSAARLPGPSPTTATSGFAEKPNRRQRSSTVSAAESPSRCGGRPMMTGTAPVSAAAAIFLQILRRCRRPSFEIRRADAPEHGGVEFPGKRPLHRKDVRRRQSRLAAGAERILHRQHAGVSTRSEIADGRKGVQLPAAGRKQDVPVHAVEILRRSGGVLDKDGVFRRSRVGPQEPEILRVRTGAGRGDALGDALGVRVRRVDDKIEALAAEELRHLLARQRPRGNVSPLSLREQHFAVFRSHAHGHVRALPGEKLGDLASLGRTGKYAELRHPAPLCGGSRAASPSRRRSFRHGVADEHGAEHIHIGIAQRRASYTRPPRPRARWNAPRRRAGPPADTAAGYRTPCGDCPGGPAAGVIKHDAEIRLGGAREPLFDLPHGVSRLLRLMTAKSCVSGAPSSAPPLHAAVRPG